MQWRGLIVVCCAVLAATGCEKRFENRNLEQVRQNMSQKEVESILGQPKRTEKAELELETDKKTMVITRYYYEQNGQTIVLHLQNGKLINDPDLLKEN
jgi:E3 ubiquitin-protein ligase DOA10